MAAAPREAYYSSLKEKRREEESVRGEERRGGERGPDRNSRVAAPEPGRPGKPPIPRKAATLQGVKQFLLLLILPLTK
jgi:hypothetical protein